MKRILIAGLIGTMATSAFAGTAESLLISLGIRETGSTAPIGGNGGFSGGIEWVNIDGQTLNLDGTWQQFTFGITTDPLTAFAGGSANGVLDGLAGTIEHIRIRSNGFSAGPVNLWIDDIANTVTPVGGSPVTTTFGDFEGYPDGTEVMFQEPGFSGSTSGNILLNPNVAGVDSSMAHSGAASYNVQYQYLDSAPTRWVRLTTFNVANQGNPTIRFDDQSEVTFWMKGNAVPEPATMAVLGFGALALLRKRRKA